ncbi:MAG: potassium transporter Trk [Synergistaceae bacterium]|jgi:trk system potassium uptake protein TrkH|nr:potassium transporter Trk [Synergistaceae bacterium]
MRTYSSAGVEKYITLGFLSLILAGTLLLLAASFAGDAPLAPADALFLSASAVCVTGFSPIGPITALPTAAQIILLILVQLGGVGIMGATTLLAFMTGNRLQLRQRLFIATEMGSDSPTMVLGLLRFVVIFTAASELAGACVLATKFVADGAPTGKAVCDAVFLSVNAFCSGGFAPYPDSLARFGSSVMVPGVFMTLMMIGGIGFPLISELRDRFLGRVNFLSPYAKIVLISTAAFTVGGAALYAAVEWNSAFSGLPGWSRLWNALFASVSARGGGFYTVDYSHWSAEGLMVTLFLMFIGGAPFSTAGGLKVTTFAILLLAAASELRQEEDIVVYHRRIPYSTVRRALAIAFIYIITLFVAVGALSKLEPFPFSRLVFEAVSALGTSGLTSGVSENLSNAGKMVIVLLMFWGRVGILTFSYSLVRREHSRNVSFPDTNIPIG